MRLWRQMPRALIPGLWFLFGELIYKLWAHERPPVWHDLPGYTETLVGFLVGWGWVRWWRDRRLRRSEHRVK